MTEFLFKNKVAVITGAARGIGFAIAEEFLKNDAKTIILLDIIDRGNKAANELNSKYGAEKAIFIKCDVTKDMDIVAKQIFDKYKKIDILVNNAGVVKEDSVRTTMEVNAIAVMEWSLKFQEHMSKDKDGTIINISSAYGYIIDEFLPLYKASKFAIFGFSKTLGHKLNYEESGVRVIVICPGLTRTDLGKTDSGVKKQDSIDAQIKIAIFQDPDAVGRAAVEVYEHAESGTAWFISENKLSEVK